MARRDGADPSLRWLKVKRLREQEERDIERRYGPPAGEAPDDLPWGEPERTLYRCSVCGRVMLPWCLMVPHARNPRAARPRSCDGWPRSGALVRVPESD